MALSPLHSPSLPNRLKKPSSLHSNPPCRLRRPRPRHGNPKRRTLNRPSSKPNLHASRLLLRLPRLPLRPPRLPNPRPPLPRGRPLRAGRANRGLFRVGRQRNPARGRARRALSAAPANPLCMRPVRPAENKPPQPAASLARSRHPACPVVPLSACGDTSRGCVAERLFKAPCEAEYRLSNAGCAVR